MRATRAQASVETVVLIPVIAACAFGAWQVLMVAWALVAAGDAAHTGARALLSHERARPAVQAALPGSMRDGMSVQIGAQKLTVSVTVPSVIPGFAPRISASADVVRS